MTPLAAAVFFGTVVLTAVGGDALGARLTRMCRPVACAGYSIYHAHPLALHVARGAVERVAPSSVALYFLAASLATLAFTLVIYLLTERTALALRDRLAPRRSAPAVPGVAPPVALA